MHCCVCVIDIDVSMCGDVCVCVLYALSSLLSAAVAKRAALLLIFGSTYLLVPGYVGSGIFRNECGACDIIRIFLG